MTAESSYPSINRITYPFASTHVPLSLSWTPVLTKERTSAAQSLRAGHNLSRIRLYRGRIASDAGLFLSVFP